LELFSGFDSAYFKLFSLLKNVDFSEFFHDLRYVLIFYVLGDLLTTVFAIENGMGYEANFLIAVLLDYFGYYSIVILKLIFISFCFLDYLYLKRRGYRSMWDITRHMISLLGILVVINNLLVISGLWVPIYSFIYSI